MKLLGRFSVLSATFFVIVILSTALGFISYRYYKQQSQLNNFFKDEQVGVLWSEKIARQMIQISFSEKVQPSQVMAATELLTSVHDLIYKSHTFRSEVAKLNLNFPSYKESEDRIKKLSSIDLTNSVLVRQELQKASHFYLNALLDQSNLILDPEFRTYNLIDAFLVHYPLVFSNHSPTSNAQLNENDILKMQVATTVNFESYDYRLQKTILAQSLIKEASATEINPQLLDKLRASSDQFKLLMQNLQINKIEHDQDLLQQAVQNLENGLAVFSSINENRIKSTESAMLASIITAVLLWLFSMIVVVMIVFSVMQTNNILKRVIDDQWQALDRAQKLATLGEVSASIGHDIVNPLMIIKMTTRTLEKLYTAEKPESKEYLERVNRMVDRIDSIIKSMKSFLGYSIEVKLEEVRVKNVFDDVNLFLSKKLIENKVKLDLSELNLEQKVQANESEMVQVFVNLINNSIDALRDVSEKKIYVKSEVKNDSCFFTVTDTGPGVPKHIQKKIFEALFTTKSLSDGTGLGLSISQKIIAKYGGDISYVDIKSGACFQVTLKAI